MFQSSSRIDSRLTREVEQVERVPGYQVLSAKLFWTPVLNIEVDCEVLRPRKVKLLEEFVLRAAIELKDTPISWEELSELLGVDKRFIKRTVDDLQLTRALKPSTDLLLATETGEEFYTKGQVPQPPQNMIVNLACVLPLMDFAVLFPRHKTRVNAEVEDIVRLPGVVDVEDATIGQVLQNTNEHALIEATARTGHPIHDPGEGNILQRISETSLQSKDKTYWAVLIVRDVLDDHIFVQVRNWGNPAITSLQINQMESWLDEILDRGTIQLLDLMQMGQSELDDLMHVTSEMLEGVVSHDESRASAVERLVQSEVLDIRTNSTSEILEIRRETGTAELVRDSDIRPSFLDALEQARKRVLIVSPWMTEQAVDDKLINLFAKLAEKRVITVLGWGIAKQVEEEDKPPTSSLLNKLGKIFTPEGLPAVSVVWLGNQHSKDVIIDNEIHLCGSHNWLSYRGDFQPRGESVYRVTIPEQVRIAADVIERLFSQCADNEWNTLLQFPAEQPLEKMFLSLISTWIGIGKFDTACRRSVEIATSRHLITPISVLTGAATERLFGANPNTRIELLYALGRIWNDDGINNPRGDNAPPKLFVQNIRSLMERLARENEADLRTAMDLHIPVWHSMGVLAAEETIDGFVQTAISGSSQRSPKSKTRKVSQK